MVKRRFVSGVEPRARGVGFRRALLLVARLGAARVRAKDAPLSRRRRRGRRARRGPPRSSAAARRRRRGSIPGERVAARRPAGIRAGRRRRGFGGGRRVLGGGDAQIGAGGDKKASRRSRERVREPSRCSASGGGPSSALLLRRPGVGARVARAYASRRRASRRDAQCVSDVYGHLRGGAAALPASGGDERARARVCGATAAAPRRRRRGRRRWLGEADERRRAVMGAGRAVAPAQGRPAMVKSTTRFL